MSESLATARDLTVRFRTHDSTIHAVNGVDFDVHPREVLCILGESGSGKSVTLRSLMRLNPPAITQMLGTLRVDGHDIMTASEQALEEIRGPVVAMIPQEPMTSLDPVFTIGQQITEAILRHERVRRREASRRALELLDLVQIPSAPRRLASYPHELSGGLRQRAMIAIALACEPKLLIADEPTTALDVTIQAQILDLMRELQQTTGTAIVLITHDMGVVAENADRVVVMYAGHKVEEASADDLFDSPLHPYTKGLLGSVPNLEVAAHLKTRRARLNAIKGIVPSLANLPQGCAFAPRCRFATEECRAISPPLEQHRPGHWVACWHAGRLLGSAA